MGDKVKTRVVFKEFKGEVVAFLLDVPANKGMIMTYAHIGQHSEASKEFYQEIFLATPKKYNDLKEELESIGYDLEIHGII
jgi:hypothetical protein